MTTTTKPRRGRPVGTEINDSTTLQTIADMIVATPSLRPTTAVRRILSQPNSSTIRRLQVKWKQRGPRYLADAKARKAVAVAPARRNNARLSDNNMRQIVEGQRMMNDILNGPGGQAFQKATSDPKMLAMLEAQRRYLESPGMRAVHEYMNSPGMQAALEFQKSPAMQLMRDMQNNPTMRLLREMQDSPVMQADRDLKAHMRLISGD